MLTTILILLALTFVILAAVGHAPLWLAVLFLVLERLIAFGPRLFAVGAIVLLSSTAAHGQTIDDWNRALAGAALVTHAADGMSTIRATVTGTGVEANRFARPFVGGEHPQPLAYFGLKFGTAYGSFLLKDWLREKAPKWVLVANIAEIGAFAAVGWNNYRVYQRAQGK